MGTKLNTRASSGTQKMKGQNEPISLVLISGIIVGLVSAAYFWGMPIINKNVVSTDFATMNNQLKDISAKVISLANAGGGKADIELTKTVHFISSDAAGADNNTFSITISNSQPMLYAARGGATIYVGSSSFSDMSELTGIFGESPPGIITFTQSSADKNVFLMKSKLRMRPLLTTGFPYRRYFIKLCAEGDSTCTKELTGNSRLTLIFEGTETAMEAEGETTTTKIGVRMS